MIGNLSSLAVEIPSASYLEKMGEMELTYSLEEMMSAGDISWNNLVLLTSTLMKFTKQLLVYPKTDDELRVILYSSDKFNILMIGDLFQSGSCELQESYLVDCSTKKDKTKVVQLLSGTGTKQCSKELTFLNKQNKLKGIRLISTSNEEHSKLCLTDSCLNIIDLNGASVKLTRSSCLHVKKRRREEGLTNQRLCMSKASSAEVMCGLCPSCKKEINSLDLLPSSFSNETFVFDEPEKQMTPLEVPNTLLEQNFNPVLVLTSINKNIIPKLSVWNNIPYLCIFGTTASESHEKMIISDLMNIYNKTIFSFCDTLDTILTFIGQATMPQQGYKFHSSMEEDSILTVYNLHESVRPQLSTLISRDWMPNHHLNVKSGKLLEQKTEISRSVTDLYENKTEMGFGDAVHEVFRQDDISLERHVKVENKDEDKVRRLTGRCKQQTNILDQDKNDNSNNIEKGSKDLDEKHNKQSGDKMPDHYPCVILGDLLEQNNEISRKVTDLSEMDCYDAISDFPHQDDFAFEKHESGSDFSQINHNAENQDEDRVNKTDMYSSHFTFITDEIQSISPPDKTFSFPSGYVNTDSKFLSSEVEYQNYVYKQEKHYSEMKQAISIFDQKEVILFLRGAKFKQVKGLDQSKRENRNNTKTFVNDLEEMLYKPRQFYCPEIIVAPFVSLRHYFDEVAQGKEHAVQEEMAFEGLRLKTFHKVKISTSSIHLAAAGFYATGEEDETRCFSCGVRYRRWQSKDIPIQVHRRISPDCSYITGSDTSNVPIDSTASPSVLSADLINGDARAESTSWIRNENNSSVGASTVGSMINNPSNINNSIAVDSSMNQASGSNTETTNTPNFNNAVYPHYSDTKARITSFSTWPPGHCKKPADLVLVGFFYAGYADCVRCFVCGVGLRTWEAGDDPWEEHVRWRSSCDFVRAVKGEEFIAQTLAAIGRASQQTDPRVSNGIESNSGVHGGNDVSNILSRAVCRQAIEMGFSTELVRQHATDIVQAQGDRTLQLEVLLEKLLQDNGNSQAETVQQTRAATREQTTPIAHELELPIRNYPENCPAEPQQTAPRDKTSYSNNAHEEKHMTGAQQSTLNSESSNTPSTGKKINDSDHGGRQAEEKHGEQQARHNPAGEDFGDEGFVGSNDMMDDPEDTLALNSMSTIESKSKAKPQNLSHPGSNRPDTVLLTTISEENRELRESNLCKICLDDPANIVFLPCGHLVACAMCTPALERCPVCRSFIRGSVRAHLTSMVSITNHDS